MGWFSKLLEGKKAQPSPDAVYLDMRAQIFRLTQDGLPDHDERDGPLAVVMDRGGDALCYSFVAVADGSVSLYFGSGGGILGTGAYARVAKASKFFVANSSAHQSSLESSSEWPLPDDEQVALSLITTEGVYRGVFKEDELGNNRSPLSPLFHQIHALIGMIQQISELKEQESPLVFAAAMDLGQLAKEELAKGVDPNLLSSEGRSAIGVATLSGSLGVITLLANAGVDVDASIEVQPEEKAPLLCTAAAADELGSLGALLDAGANIEGKDPSGLGSLHFASFLGRESIAELLLQRGADIESREGHGYTPLMMAANASQEKMVEVLLTDGAAVAATDNDGSTPLMFAAQHENARIVELLLSAEADPTVSGSHGMSALDFAKQSDHPEIVKLLKAERP